MNDEDDTTVIRPTLKLSKCSRKPRKRVAATHPHRGQVDKPAAKRTRRRKKDDIPIPSFSPVHNMEELDTSILDSPVKEEVDVILFQDDDDDDDELLMGPPTFASNQADQHSKTLDQKPTNNKVTVDSPKRTPARQVSSDENATIMMHDEIPSETVQSIDALLKEVDLSRVTLREMLNTTVGKLGFDGNKAMRKLIRAHIKSRMRKDDGIGIGESSPESLAEQPKEDRNADTEMVSRETKERASKQTPCKPDENSLIVSIDTLFVQADTKNVTLGEFVTALKAEYGAKLHKTSRAFVKARLKKLLAGTIDPNVSLPTAVSEDAASLREEASNPQRDDTMYDAAASIVKDDDPDPAQNQDTQSRTSPSAVAVKETKRKEGAESFDNVADREVERVEAQKPPESPEKTEEIDPKTKKRGRPPKKKTRPEEIIETADESVSFTDQGGRGDSREKPREKAEKPKRFAPKTTTRARTKKGTCALCTTCTCTIGKETNVNDTPATNMMSRTDAEIERALLKKTKKLETIVDKYQGLLDQVNRELKKHRRGVWKKQEAQLNGGKRLAFGDSRFLPEADVWDAQAEAVHLEALPSEDAQKAQGTVFGCKYFMPPNPHAHYNTHLQYPSFTACQPTLTQIFGGGGSKTKDETAEETDHSIDPEDEENTSVVDVCSQTGIDEDSSESILDGEESLAVYSELDTEANPVDHVHRLSWRKGTKVEAHSPLLRGSGAWAALTTKATGNSHVNIKLYSPHSVASSTRGPRSLLLSNSPNSKYNCAWDALFSDDVADDDTRMDQLLHLFENEMLDDGVVTSDSSTRAQAFSQQSDFETVLLTQRGETVAETIEEEIMSDPTQMKLIEAVCPKWRDNIRYALAQRGPEEIRQALEGVRRSMKNLQATKEKVITIWKRQEVVLQLFEMSLSASLSRLSTSGSPERHARKVDDESAIASPVQMKAATMALSPIVEGDEMLTG